MLKRSPLAVGPPWCCRPYQVAAPDSAAPSCAAGRPATAQADTRDYLMALRAHMRKAVDDGQDISAAICPTGSVGDVDLFAVGLVDGQPIRATITFMNRNGAGDLDLRLLTGDGGSVLDDSKTSADTELVMCPGGSPCPPITNGTYLIEVKGFTASVTSAYVLHIETTADVAAGVDAP